MLNHVSLIGRMAVDPEVRYAPSGTAVCNFRVGVTRDIKDADGTRQSDFFNVVCFKGTAEFVQQYVTKGRLIAVEGRLQVRQWKTDQGENRSAVEVVANRVDPLERAKEDDAQPGNQQAAPRQQPQQRPQPRQAPPPPYDRSDPFADSIDIPDPFADS
jgi:single-strand DNA-binding protein